MTKRSGKSRNEVRKHEVIGGSNEIMAIYEASKLPLSVYFASYSHDSPLFNTIACHGLPYRRVSVLFSVQTGYVIL